jgi:osmotically-inducible protein OsmY
MADDRWREDERRRWDEDRNRYGRPGHEPGGWYGQRGFGGSEDRSYRPFGERAYGEHERPGQEFSRGYGSQQNYGEGFRGQGQGSSWYGGEDDRYRRGYGYGGGVGGPLYGGGYGREGWRGYGEGWSGGGYGGGYLGGGTSSYGGYGRGDWRGYGEGEGWAGPESGYRGGREQDRSWWNRAADEISSWMGDEDAERRRRMDQARGGYYGKGPRGYTRSDDRIREDVNDRLTDDWAVDATNIEVTVSKGEVTLSGSVNSREDKRRAEDLAEKVSGVRHVQNNLRVQQAAGETASGETRTTTAAGVSRSAR